MLALALARYAAASKAHAVARLPEERRLAILVAFARTLEATTQDDVLARPPDEPHFDELLARCRRIRRFLPDLVRAAHFGAAPAARPSLAAVQHLRQIGSKPLSGRKLPIEFVPQGWRPRVVRDGVVDPKVWTLCLVERMRAASRWSSRLTRA